MGSDRAKCEVCTGLRAAPITPMSCSVAVHCRERGWMARRGPFQPKGFRDGCVTSKPSAALLLCSLTPPEL